MNNTPLRSEPIAPGRVDPQTAQMFQASGARPVQGPRASDVDFWLGSGGLLHNLGVGVVGIFAGPQAAQTLGGISGGLQDMGIQALNERDAAGGELGPEGYRANGQTGPGVPTAEQYRA